MTVVNLPKRRRNAKVPLRIGDVWVLLGPRTEYVIIALRPRPTAQKPDSQAVTLSDGRTITEATLRFAYQRWQEHQDSLVALRAKLRALFAEESDQRAEVIPFPTKGKP